MAVNVLTKNAACCSQLCYVKSRCVDSQLDIQLPLTSVRFFTTLRTLSFSKMVLLHEVSYLLQIKMCDKPVLSRALVLFALSRLATAK